EERVDEERKRAEPREREAPPAARERGPECLRCSSRRQLRPHLARPLLGDEVLRRRLLAVVGELHLRVDARRRQRREQRLWDHLPPREILEPRRVREALQPEQLP